MEYRPLGRTGVKVSPLCFGTDNFADPTPEPECIRMLDRAFDAGINLLDTGDIYAEGEGERIIGRALKANGRRHATLISTKVDHLPGVNLDVYNPGINPNHHGHSRLNIIRACEQALERLQTDYIDLYQMPGYNQNVTLGQIHGMAKTHFRRSASLSWQSLHSRHASHGIRRARQFGGRP